MVNVSKLREAWSTALGTSLAWLIIGLINVFFWTLLILIMPFVMVRLALQRRWPDTFGNPGGVDPEDVAAFDAVWEDLCAGNIPALNELARPIDDARSAKRHEIVAVLRDWMERHPKADA